MPVFSYFSGPSGSSGSSISPASSALAGSMSISDFIKLGASASANTASTIVQRDSSGNFAASTITAALTGTASNSSNLGTQSPAFYTSRTNHTGTQTSATISDFDVQARLALAMAPAKITTIGANTVTIPATAIGFNYVLCAAGGGGGNGGTTIGGGGAAAGEFVAGNVLISELMATLTLTRTQVILTVTIGNSTAIGERGNSSSLAIGSNSIAIAQGGYGGLSGTTNQGWGPWSGGITYTSAGGIGQIEQRNEAMLIGEPNAATIARLNLFGDGGNGGSSGGAGLLGKSGYFSIQFF